MTALNDLQDQQRTGPFREIAEEGGRLGLEIVDVASHVEGLSRTFSGQAEAFKALLDTAGEILARDRDLGVAAVTAQSAVHSAAVELDGSRDTVVHALADICSLVETVQATSQRLTEIQSSIESVSRIAVDIAAIARHTNMLALNASVEAAHAGSYGAGFSVIAHAVKTLAGEARDAANRVDESLRVVASQAGGLAEDNRRGQQQAEDVGRGAQAIAQLIDFVSASMTGIGDHVGAISENARVIETRVQHFESKVEVLGEGVHAARGSLDGARDRLNGLMTVAERILQHSIAAGVETPDTPFTKLAVELAAAVERLFVQEVAAGRIAMPDLFDERYVPLDGSNPPQFVTRFTALTDRLLPALQEAALERLPGIVFAVAVDRNGYLPTHNRQFSHPQGADPVWNAAHCRNRRIFDDRVGLAAARNRKPFLLQCYRRDMGGDNFVLMKDVSAPVTLGDRHWGAVRIGCRLAS